MKNIIFIAPPAAGKGTVSDYLVKNYNYEHLSTGDLLREVIKSGSEFGQEIDKIISSGALVSDDIIIKLVSDKLESLDDAKPFILDGFPRTLNQAHKLNEMLISAEVTNNVAIYLDINLEEAMKRVLGRITCPKCKRSYNVNIEKLKPINDNLCDDCGVELESRNDDNEETFKVRFNTYLENTSPIIDYYKAQGILKSFDVRREPNVICEDILGEVKND
ncbi:MAG: nucleoside monophosphate kinase [Bacilli bacterium]|nr:nucleoside monophosphate kinase [Bacilli bacterium]